MMRPNKCEPVSDRRRILKILGGGLAAGLGLPLACGSGSEGAATRIPLARVPVGTRVRVLDGENPVELQRAASGAVSGRSLWCTHFGCEVVWNEERAVYLCPCHDGIFDSEGRPISGPPVRALASVAVSVGDGEIVIAAGGAEGSESSG